MVDLEEQNASLEQVLLIEAQRTWYHGDKKGTSEVSNKGKK